MRRVTCLGIVLVALSVVASATPTATLTLESTKNGQTVQAGAAIDWTIKESVRAKLMVLVKRTLAKYGYPPDKQEKATQTVLEQAELLCKDWVV